MKKSKSKAITEWPTDEASMNPALREATADRAKRSRIKWPKRPIIFMSDLHADPDALVDSLVDVGAAKRTKKGPKLTSKGRQHEIMIGGDCLDKGPSNLGLLRHIKTLRKQTKRLTVLAGNHDLRLLMGLLALDRKKTVGNAHLFIRMGKKVIPLFKEVFDDYLADKKWDKKIPNEAECRRRMFPSGKWFDDFELFAAGHLTSEGIDRELSKLRNKIEKFEHHCAANGLTLRQVYAAAEYSKKLFIKPGGEFHWFYKDMDLLARRGSFVFLHAGLDDAMAQLLKKRGPRYANKAFHHNLKQNDLFGFYYSPLANTFRTKYRAADLPLTESGRKAILKSGTRVLVQGHVNRKRGQRLALKCGVLHLECDVTLDRHSRAREGLAGIGYGSTLISKRKGLRAVSADYEVPKSLSRKGLESLVGAVA